MLSVVNSVYGCQVNTIFGLFVNKCRKVDCLDCFLQDSSTGPGAGYEQAMQQFKNGDMTKDAKKNVKKVGSTMNKKANEGGSKVSSQS